MKKLNIIMNEKIYKDQYSFYSENVDCKSIVEGLKEKFDIKLFARKTNVKKKNKLLFFNISLSNSILIFLFNIIRSLRNRKKCSFLIISITPYTFFSYLILFFFSKNIFLYLRSDGFKEYSFILGRKWTFLYSIMFYVITKKTKIIACDTNLSKGKNFYYVKPSEIDEDWLLNRKIQKNEKIKILYVGRFKVEKGIFNFIELFGKIDDVNINLSITSDELPLIKISDDRIKFLPYISQKKKLIELYDNHDILILPSYTEAYPKVIDEALSRLKPVIVFKDIKHVIKGRSGVYCAERNALNLKETIYFITNNYDKIVFQIKKNKLPTKKIFLDSLSSIIYNN
jgi:glycosyltransferase involved in cell wall biosynthesis